MALTPSETEQLLRLQAKAKENPAPLTEHDLEKMEATVAAATGVSADFMVAANDAWSGYWNKVMALASDNARLIAEVRRLSSNNQVERQP